MKKRFWWGDLMFSNVLSQHLGRRRRYSEVNTNRFCYDNWVFRLSENCGYVRLQYFDPGANSTKFRKVRHTYTQSVFHVRIIFALQTQTVLRQLRCGNLRWNWRQSFTMISLRWCTLGTLMHSTLQRIKDNALKNQENAKELWHCVIEPNYSIFLLHDLVFTFQYFRSQNTILNFNKLVAPIYRVKMSYTT